MQLRVLLTRASKGRVYCVSAIKTRNYFEATEIVQTEGVLTFHHLRIMFIVNGRKLSAVVRDRLFCQQFMFPVIFNSFEAQRLMAIYQEECRKECTFRRFALS